MTYTPDNNPESLSYSDLTPTGYSSRALANFENAGQAAVANTKEQWNLAVETIQREDSQAALTELGFAVHEANGMFYSVTPPSGWTKETKGYWTEIKNESGTVVAAQFYKAAIYDTEAFINIFGS